MENILVIIGIILCIELAIVIMLLERISKKSHGEIVVTNSTENRVTRNSGTSGKLASEQNVVRGSLVICPNCYGAVKQNSKSCQFCGNSLSRR